MLLILFILGSVIYSIIFTKRYVNAIYGNARYDGDHPVIWLYIRNWLYHIIVSIISYIIFVICITAISSFTGHWMTEVIDKEISSTNINPLKDQFTENSGWYYETGTVEGELSYFYAINTKNGEAIRHASAFDCYINYDDSVIPNITFYERTRIYNKFWRKMLFIETVVVDEDIEEYSVITIPSSAKNYKGFNFD